MNTSSLRAPVGKSPSHQAFTLIELLVVISIIAVLAGLLLPVGNAVIVNSKKVSAKSTMVSVVNAVKNYQAEYGTYPVVPAAAGATQQDTTFITGIGSDTSGDQNYKLFAVLRAQNSGTSGSTPADPVFAALNSRRIVYFENRDAKNPAAPRDGFVVPKPGETTTTAKDVTGAVNLTVGDLMDPFGNLYAIRIDTGYSDKVMDPLQATGSGQADDAGTTDETKMVHTSVIAWTLGNAKTLYQQTGGTTGPSFESSGNVATWK